MKRNILLLLLISILQSFSLIVLSQRINGKVSDIEGIPLAGASVTVAGTFMGVTTGDDGSYSLTGLKQGMFSIRFSFIGYEARIINIVLTSDTTLNIVLKQMAILTSDVIINATRAGTNDPVTFTNISSDVLERHNVGQDLPYLLCLTPSFIETSEAGNGIGYTNLRIRGTDASRINVTIDGIPLNDPESQQVFWVDLPDLASSVDNIQVQRGVGTSSNGAGAFGASINIQTQNTEYEPFAEINSSVGSYNTFKNNILAGTGLLKERFAFQIRLSDIKSDGFIQRTGSAHNSAFMSALYRTDRSMLKMNFILGREHTGIGWWGVPKEMLQENRRYNPAGEYTDKNGMTQYYDNESDNYIQNHVQLIYSRKMKNGFSFQSAFHYTRGKGYYEEYKENRSFTDYGLQPFSLGDTTIFTTDLIRRKWMSNDFYGMIYSLKYKTEKIESILGGGINLYLGDHYGRIIWMEYPGTTERDHQWYLNTGEKSEFNIYGKIRYSLSERISAYGDIQYRHIGYTMDGIDDDLKDIGQNHMFNFLNPKAGLFYSISPNQEAYFSLSVANREPTRTDFKEAAGDPGATPLPERLYDTEFGYKLNLNRSAVTINFYWMIYKDQLVPTGELSNVGYSIMTNVDKSYRAGIEFAAGFTPADFLKWDMTLTLSRNKIIDFTEHYIDYNTSDWSSEYKTRDLGTVDIAYSPSVSGSSDISIMLKPELRIHFLSKYVGKQYFDNTMNELRMIDPYFVNNLMIDFEPEIKLIRGSEFQLFVGNIFNTKYESNAYGGNWFEDGTEKTWSYYFPQAGINYLFRVKLRF
jgi:iron complex outermembrane receptor protein